MNGRRRFFAQIAQFRNGDLVIHKFLADHAFFYPRTAGSAAKHVITREHDHVDLVFCADLAELHLGVVVQLCS